MRCQGRDRTGKLKLAVEHCDARIARSENAALLIASCACLNCQQNEHPYRIALTPAVLNDGPAVQDLSEWVKDIQLQQLQMSFS